jgi:hypothetical protein
MMSCKSIATASKGLQPISQSGTRNRRRRAGSDVKFVIDGEKRALTQAMCLWAIHHPTPHSRQTVPQFLASERCRVRCDAALAASAVMLDPIDHLST